MNRKQRRAMGLPKAAASPIEYDLNGHTLLLRPLRIDDWGRVEAKMKQMVRAEYMSDLTPDTDPETRRLVIGMAHEAAAKISVLAIGDDANVNRLMHVPEVVITVLHCSLREEHPDMTVDDVRGWFTLADLDVMMRMFTAVMHASGFEGEADTPAETGKGNGQSADNFRVGDSVPDTDGCGGVDAGAGGKAHFTAGGDAGGEAT